MRFETFVALRYLRSKRRNRFVSLITLISVAGVGVGVMALIVVMSVMTGFDKALMASFVDFHSHLKVYPAASPTFDDWRAVVGDVEGISDEVLAASPVIQIPAMLRNGDAYHFALINGMDVELEQAVTNVATNLTREGGRTYGHGELPGDRQIVLGYRMAHQLNAFVGSWITVLTFRPQRGGLLPGRPSTIALQVSGISQARMAEFDNRYAFTTLEWAEKIRGQEGVDAVHARLDDAFAAEEVAQAIGSIRDQDGYPRYDTVTWFEENASFLGALRQEKIVMFIILAFIILVAAFNITSTLIMVVMEKRQDIGILRTLGVSGSQILLLFIIEGLFIGLSGTFGGVVAGTLFAYNLNPIAEFVADLLGLPLFDSPLYFFDQIPVAVVPSDILWITLSAVVLTFLSTLYPAWSAARLNPVDALRYE